MKEIFYAQHKFLLIFTVSEIIKKTKGDNTIMPREYFLTCFNMADKYMLIYIIITQIVHMYMQHYISMN
jgi:hypothetical protein